MVGKCSTILLQSYRFIPKLLFYYKLKNLKAYARQQMTNDKCVFKRNKVGIQTTTTFISLKCIYIDFIKFVLVDIECCYVRECDTVIYPVAPNSTIRCCENNNSNKGGPLYMLYTWSFFLNF